MGDIYIMLGFLGGILFILYYIFGGERSAEPPPKAKAKQHSYYDFSNHTPYDAQYHGRD